MSDLVDPTEIEAIVGVPRDDFQHWAIADGETERVYILHSKLCLRMYPDLRDCPFSLALDRGINVDEWEEDEPCTLFIQDGRLLPQSEIWRLP